MEAARRDDKIAAWQAAVARTLTRGRPG